jgi:hypothetical protein
MGGREMQGVHGVDSGLGGFTACAFKNQADVVKHFDVLEIGAVKAEFKVTSVEDRLWTDFMPNKGTAQE